MSVAKDTEFEQRKKLFEDIKQFNRHEQEELYRILKRSGEEMSENRNGIFFDLMILKQETITTICEWMAFCSKNHTNFETREKELSKLVEANPGMYENQ
jgi:hypothetical protein